MTRASTLEIVVPVFNEECVLERQVRTLISRLGSSCPYAWTLSIVDNGSTDSTWAIASRIAQKENKVRVLHLGHPGRGGALKAAWTSSTTDMVAYMDIDLSTDLEALASLLDPVAAGSADISIGSRLVSGSQVTRSLRREIISHAYNLMARRMLCYPVRDAQCGFKAMSRRVVQTIVPKTRDDSWFFDTELLVLAWRDGLRITEVPVRWVENDDSRVRIVGTAIADLRGLWRLSSRPASEN